MKRKKSRKNKDLKIIIEIVIFIAIVISLYLIPNDKNLINENISSNNAKFLNNLESLENSLNTSYQAIENVADYSGEEIVKINNNVPYFSDEEKVTTPFEKYGELDSLGRCTTAYANICKEIMPKKNEERGEISSVRPTGWKQTKINGEYLYNRCHLIAFSLAGENANEKNLITGTRYFNVNGMLTIEKQILEYMDKNPNNHVLYRVTPDFKGENLLASGVEMEGFSVEDNGKEINFNVYVYNIEPDVTLNYATGEVVK